MQELQLHLANPRNASSYSHFKPRDSQSGLLTCPHCETLCQATGKIKNSWYVLCQCGTYIQRCDSVDGSDSVDDYSD
jgi:transcription elongation factor Elf1